MSDEADQAQHVLLFQQLSPAIQSRRRTASPSSNMAALAPSHVHTLCLLPGLQDPPQYHEAFVFQARFSVWACKLSKRLTLPKFSAGRFAVSVRKCSLSNGRTLLGADGFAVSLVGLEVRSMHSRWVWE